ncbi:glycoside hydrolase family 36 protein [Opitutus sp. ER46]|uniref:glycoside hydrolase family 36 protein n=1 Tax=Opitutus sp. ER46 TaxID=2161864 RepID=UPI000D304B13|nr:glycoside hydrolase family 36 protein [Opitutus sp. ER46]PTX90966.1 alpha-galactosidase [Opitutus sp. ER46]
MPRQTQAEYVLGDTLVRYLAPADAPEAWGLQLLPLTLADGAVEAREWAETREVAALPAPWCRLRAWDVDPLVHVQVAGTPGAGGFAAGRTLRDGPLTRSLRVVEHARERGPDGGVILRTVLAAANGLRCHHCLRAVPGGALIVETAVENRTAEPVTVEYLSAFALGGISPFVADDAPGRLRLHRFRSGWSAEARHETSSLEALHLERSWTGHAVRVERFGQVGSMPANGWFPVAALEDGVAGVTWAAALAGPGTWQLEIYRRHDQVALSGGGADRLAGEWTKCLEPGERFAAPVAALAVAAGPVDVALRRFISWQRHAQFRPVAKEQELPVVCNEWCSSWGHPTHASVVALADRLAGTGVEYLVIDDGWAERPGDGFQQNGDWRVNRRAFPEGLRATADAIRARGLIPGLWFEYECVNPGSAAWEETAHQLHRDGVPLQVGARRFWDFRDPWVHAFLQERVVGLLRDAGIGYLKVDYNDSLGPGCDGPESPGENLRRHLEGVQRFLRGLRDALPDLVIENCSSGGHRLEPSLLALSAMSSCSDAHETPDIPIIAANLAGLVWAAQKQIWAVLRPDDAPQRLAYSLAATFLGRMCLSGPLIELAPAAWAFTREAVALYREVAPVIRDGDFVVQRQVGEAWQHPVGWQVVTIVRRDDALVVWHRFAGEAGEVTLALPGTGWRQRQTWGAPALAFVEENARVGLAGAPEWSGGIIVLARR